MNNKIFVIAEAGVNHNGSLKIAYKLVDIASNAGGDAVKFQLFKTHENILLKSKKFSYVKKNYKTNLSMYEIIKNYNFLKKIFSNLKNTAKEKISNLCFRVLIHPA